MRISGVDFNENWVKSFASADEFADDIHTQHLFSCVDRRDKLRDIWGIITGKTVIDESRYSDREIESTGLISLNTGLPETDATTFRGAEPWADVEGEGIE